MSSKPGGLPSGQRCLAFAAGPGAKRQKVCADSCCAGALRQHRDASGSSFAPCPVCGKQVPLLYINLHLDECCAPKPAAAANPAGLSDVRYSAMLLSELDQRQAEGPALEDGFDQAKLLRPSDSVDEGAAARQICPSLHPAHSTPHLQQQQELPPQAPPPQQQQPRAHAAGVGEPDDVQVAHGPSPRTAAAATRVAGAAGYTCARDSSAGAAIAAAPGDVGEEDVVCISELPAERPLLPSGVQTTPRTVESASVPRREHRNSPMSGSLLAQPHAQAACATAPLGLGRAATGSAPSLCVQPSHCSPDWPQAAASAGCASLAAVPPLRRLDDRLAEQAAGSDVCGSTARVQASKPPMVHPWFRPWAGHCHATSGQRLAIAWPGPPASAAGAGAASAAATSDTAVQPASMVAIPPVGSSAAALIGRRPDGSAALASPRGGGVSDQQADPDDANTAGGASPLRVLQPVLHPCLEGQYLVSEFVTLEEEAELLALCGDPGLRPAWSPWAGQPYGNATAQKTRGKRWGVLPDYHRRGVAPLEHPLPPLLRLLAQRMRARVGLGLLRSFNPNEANAIDYRRSRGSWLRPHVDDRILSGDVIVNLSLAGAAVMTFAMEKSKDRSREEVRVLLPPRSLQILSRAARYSYTHAIAPADLLDERRVSITFRRSELRPFEKSA